MQQRGDFLGSFYGGVHCGATVLTTVVYVETFMLFYTLALPVAEALNMVGVPAIFRYTDTSTKYVLYVFMKGSHVP